MLATITTHLLPRPSGRARTNRRGARRQVPAQLTPCRIVLSGEAEPTPGWLQNLSVKGVGLLLRKPCPVGTIVPLLLINAAHTCGLRLELQVVRCQRLASGDHIVGGQFTQGRDFEELLPFLT